MRTLGVICARSGSKLFPGKNLAEVNGKPILYYTIEAASESKLLDRTVVSTNSETIAAVARSYNADVPFLRPQEYSTCTVRIELALGHALGFCEAEEGEKYDCVVLLQNTSFARKTEEIDGCIAVLEDNWDVADSSATVHVVDHPHMLYIYDKQHRIIIPMKPEWREIFRRQDAPVVYMINGVVFAVKRDLLLLQGRILTHRCVPYLLPQYRGIDIDSIKDLEFARMLING